VTRWWPSPSSQSSYSTEQNERFSDESRRQGTTSCEENSFVLLRTSINNNFYDIQTVKQYIDVLGIYNYFYSSGYARILIHEFLVWMSPVTRAVVMSRAEATLLPWFKQREQVILLVVSSIIRMVQAVLDSIAVLLRWSKQFRVVSLSSSIVVQAVSDSLAFHYLLWWSNQTVLLCLNITIWFYATTHTIWMW